MDTNFASSYHNKVFYLIQDNIAYPYSLKFDTLHDLFEKMPMLATPLHEVACDSVDEYVQLSESLLVVDGGVLNDFLRTRLIALGITDKQSAQTYLAKKADIAPCDINLWTSSREQNPIKKVFFETLDSLEVESEIELSLFVSEEPEDVQIDIYFNLINSQDMQSWYACIAVDFFKLVDSLFYA